MAINKLLNKSFFTRAVSGIILLIIIAVTAIIGEDVLFATVFCVSLIGLYEIYRVIGIEKGILGYLGYFSAAVYFIVLRFYGSEYFEVFAVGYLLLVMAVYVFSFPKYKANQIMASYFSLIYVPVLMSYLYQLRMLNNDGIFTFWLIFICSWGCDTCAYLAGVTMGKHKMAPVLSPKKSVEGAIGGVIGAAIIGGLYGYIIEPYLDTINNAPLLFAIVCAMGGLISMVGDLCASAIKRNYEIKDYGTLIPGHGGIMDRFDSVIFTAPLIYFLIEFLGNKL
jgi:phosphatidate cytidylyltransferase